MARCCSSYVSSSATIAAYGVDMSHGCMISAVPSPKEQVAECKRLVRCIPTANMEVLKRLMQLLAEVAEFQSINNMNTKNLAIVFAPNLFRARESTTLQLLKDTPFIMSATKTLIEYRDEIFPVRRRHCQRCRRCFPTLLCCSSLFHRSAGRQLFHVLESRQLRRTAVALFDGCSDPTARDRGRR